MSMDPITGIHRRSREDVLAEMNFRNGKIEGLDLVIAYLNGLPWKELNSDEVVKELRTIRDSLLVTQNERFP